MSEASKRANSAPALVLSEFLPYRIVVLGRLVSRRLSHAYAGENLTIPEWRVLAVISQAEAMAARDVVARTPLDKMAVSRAVSTLEEKGLVEREAHPKDRRVAALRLSAKGRTLFGRVAALALAYEEALLEPLPPGDRKRFLDLLGKLEASAGRAPAGGLPAPANSD